MAETPVAGRRRSTGKRRGQVVSAPSRELRSGLNYTTGIAARPVNIQTPNIRVPKHPLAETARKLGFASKQLDQYQQAKADEWKSEAEMLAQDTINQEIASGKSMKEIQENFRNGVYPELKSQLQLDMFNSVYGHEAANKYFNDPNGEGYKAVEEWNKEFLAAPFEKRQNMNHEQFLAQIQQKFREQYSSGKVNPKLLAGARRATAVKFEKLRKDFQVNYERRLDEDRTNAVVSQVKDGLAALSSEMQMEDDQYGVESSESYEDKINKSPYRVEALLQDSASKLDMDGQEKKRAKLAIVESFITNSSLQRTSEAQKSDLEVARKILTTKLKGPLPRLIEDHSSFSRLGGTAGQPSRSLVKDHATGLLDKINSHLSAINKDQNEVVAIDSLRASIKNGDMRPFSLQNTQDYMGSGKSLSTILASAIDDERNYLSQIRNHENNPISNPEVNLRLLSFVDNLPSHMVTDGLNHFKNVAGSLKALRLSMSNNAKSGKQILSEKDVVIFRQNYALFKTLSKYNRSHLDKIYKPGSEERHLMEFFDVDRMYETSTAQGSDKRVATVQQDALKNDSEYTGSGLQEAVWNAYNKVERGEYVDTKVTQQDINNTYNEIAGDVSTGNTGFLNMLFANIDTDPSDHQRFVVEHKIKKLIEHKLKYGGKIGDIKEEVETMMETSLRSVEFAGYENTFFTPSNSPFRHNPEQANRYAQTVLDHFSKNSGIDKNELAFMPLTGTGEETNRYIIIDRQSRRPIIMDNPSLNLGNLVFTVNQQTVRDNEINYQKAERDK